MPDHLVERLNMPAQKDIQQIIRLVVLENLQANGILGLNKGIDGAEYVGLQVEEGTEAAVLNDFGLEVVAVHGGQGTEAAVDGNIAVGDYVVEDTLEGGLDLSQESGRGRVVGFVMEVAEGGSNGELLDNLRVVTVVARNVSGSGDDGKHGGVVVVIGIQACLDDLKAHVMDMARLGAELAHASVGAVGRLEVSNLIVKIGEVFLAHLWHG